MKPEYPDLYPARSRVGFDASSWVETSRGNPVERVTRHALPRAWCLDSEMCRGAGLSSHRQGAWLGMCSSGPHGISSTYVWCLGIISSCSGQGSRSTCPYLGFGPAVAEVASILSAGCVWRTLDLPSDASRVVLRYFTCRGSYNGSKFMAICVSMHRKHMLVTYNDIFFINISIHKLVVP